MSIRHGIKNRRSSSQVMPRLYLLLQIVIMILVSYIAFTILSAIGISSTLIIALIALVNLYLISKMFFKCRNISKRNAYTKKYQTN